jgi:hypothetical protein
VVVRRGEASPFSGVGRPRRGRRGRLVAGRPLRRREASGCSSHGEQQLRRRGGRRQQPRGKRDAELGET